ncbi:MAG: PKD domain-containing protein [Bacteroidota bacterium]
MKKLFKPLILLFFAGAFASCEKDRAVQIEDSGEVVNPLASYEVIKGDDAFTFQFKNSSKNYSKLEWRFGDDTLSVAENPSHLYLTTGKFQVDLKAFSSTGAITRKLVDINIVPDSVAKITAVKTGVANQIKFSAAVKATVASILWTFTDVSPAVTSTELSPVRTYPAGSFNAFTVKITTNKGSVVTLSKFVTPEGIAENITQNYVAFTPSTNNSNTNENAAKIVDNNVETKIYLGGPPLPLIFKWQFASEQTVKIYAIGNANDSESRDPKIWTLEGSKDDMSWEIVDSQTLTTSLYARAGNQYKKLHYFAVANPKPFIFYRWRVTAMWTSTNFQVSEFRLFR